MPDGRPIAALFAEARSQSVDTNPGNSPVLPRSRFHDHQFLRPAHGNGWPRSHLKAQASHHRQQYGNLFSARTAARLPLLCCKRQTCESRVVADSVRRVNKRPPAFSCSDQFPRPLRQRIPPRQEWPPNQPFHRVPLTGQGRNGRREAIFHLRTFESRRVCRLFVMLEYLDIPAIGWGWMCQAAQQGLFRPEMQQSSPTARSRSLRFRHRPGYSDPSDRKFNTCPILQSHLKCVGKH